MLKLHCERSPPCSPRRIQSARYARVSRVTPDKLLARLLTRIPTTAEPTTLSEWSIMILYQKACKPADVNPRRQQMISILEKKAEALEKTVTEPRLVAHMATPAVGARVARQETEIVKAPTRAVFDSDVSVPHDGSLAALSCKL